MLEYGLEMSWGQVLMCLALAVGAMCIYLIALVLIARIFGVRTRAEKEHYVGGWAERGETREWN